MNAGGGFIAGSIIGKMVLDMTGWTQSIAKVDADGKALGTKFDRIGQKMQDVGTKMTIVGAAVVASLSAMIIKAAKYGDEMVEVSQKVGINVTTLSSYKLAADKTGISIDGLARAIKFMSVNMVEASKGIGDGATLFGDLGVSATDSNGALRDTNDVLGDVAQKFSEMEDGAEKVTLATKLFGKAGMDLIPFLNLGRDGLAKERIEAERLGLVLSGPAADAQNKFNDQLDALKDATLGASMAIGSALIPAANAIVKIMIDAAAGVVAWTKEHPGLTKAIGGVTLAIGALLSVLGPLTVAIGAVLKNIVYLKLAASKAIVFTITLAGLAIVAAGVAKMIEDFKKLKEAGLSTAEALGTMAPSFNPFKSMSREGLGKFLTDMEAARDKSINLKGAMILLGEAFRAIKGAIEQGAIIPVINLTALFKEFGLKTRTELTAELKKAEEALKLLKGSAEATPGAIKALEDKIISLKEGITGVTVETRSLAEQLGITFRSETEERIKKLNEALLTYRGKMTAEEIARIYAEINTLTTSLTALQRPIFDVDKAITDMLTGLDDTAEEVASAISTLFSDGFEDIKKSGEQVIENDLPAYLRDLPPVTKDVTNKMSDAFAGLYNDIAIGLGHAIEGFLTGWTDAEKAAIQGIRDALWALKDEYKKAQDALDKQYKDGLISEKDYIAKSKLLLNDYNKAYKKLCDDMGKYTTGFAKLFKEVWGSIKTAFFRIIGEMIAKWLLSFIGDILVSLGVLTTSVSAATGAMTLSFSASFLAIAGAAASLVISLGFIATAVFGVLSAFGLFNQSPADLAAAIEAEKKMIHDLWQHWIDLGLSIREANERMAEWLKLTGQQKGGGKGGGEGGGGKSGGGGGGEGGGDGRPPGGGDWRHPGGDGEDYGAEIGAVFVGIGQTITNTLAAAVLTTENALKKVGDSSEALLGVPIKKTVDGVGQVIMGELTPDLLTGLDTMKTVGAGAEKSLGVPVKKSLKGIQGELEKTIPNAFRKTADAMKKVGDSSQKTMGNPVIDTLDDIWGEIEKLGKKISKVDWKLKIKATLPDLSKLFGEGGKKSTNTDYVAASAPEVSMPIREYRNAAASAGASGRNSNVNLTFNIRALDGTDMINVVHNKIKPILQNILNHNGLRVPTGAVGGA